MVGHTDLDSLLYICIQMRFLSRSKENIQLISNASTTPCSSHRHSTHTRQHYRTMERFPKVRALIQKPGWAVVHSGGSALQVITISKKKKAQSSTEGSNMANPWTSSTQDAPIHWNTMSNKVTPTNGVYQKPQPLMSSVASENDDILVKESSS